MCRLLLPGVSVSASAVSLAPGVLGSLASRFIEPFSLQQLNLLKAKQKALVEQIEKEKIQSNKGSSYKLLVEQAKLKQATSKVSAQSHLAPFIHHGAHLNQTRLRAKMLERQQSEISMTSHRR